MHTILELQETIHLKLSFCLKGNSIPERLYTWAPQIPDWLKVLPNYNTGFLSPDQVFFLFLFNYRSSSLWKTNQILNQEVLQSAASLFYIHPNTGF